MATRLVAALQAEGFSVWWDEDLTPKGAWDATLEQEIAAAATVVVLWSPRSVTSDWVRTEAHYGQDHAKRLTENELSDFSRLCHDDCGKQ